MIEHRFHTGTVSLNYAEGPRNGPPLVLLHGLSDRWQAFHSLLPALTLHHHVFALDFRGHGHSGRVPGAYSLKDYTSDVVAFLGQFQENAILFGHSLGGATALWAAARAPHRVRAVIVGDWIYPRSLESQGTQDLFSRYRDLALAAPDVDSLANALVDVPMEHSNGAKRLADVPFIDAARLRFYARGLKELDPDVFSAAIDGRLAAGYDPDSFLPDVRCPVFILQGDPAAGGLLTDDDINRARRLLPWSTHVCLNGVGHDLHQESSGPVARAVSLYLESL